VPRLERKEKKKFKERGKGERIKEADKETHALMGEATETKKRRGSSRRKGGRNGRFIARGKLGKILIYRLPLDVESGWRRR